MPEQREKPAPSKEQLEKTLGVEPSPNNLVGGGQLENFREGWALDIMRSSPAAHYFKRGDSFDQAKSLCGFIGTVRWLYAPGNFPKCIKCSNRLALSRNNQMVRD